MAEPNTVWVTAYDRKIPFTELTDEHLCSILRLLKRRACLKRIQTIMTYLRGPAPDEGLHAYDSFIGELEQAMESDWLDFVVEVYGPLSTLAMQRGLEWDTEAPLLSALFGGGDET